MNDDDAVFLLLKLPRQCTFAQAKRAVNAVDELAPSRELRKAKILAYRKVVEIRSRENSAFALEVEESTQRLRDQFGGGDCLAQ